MSFLFEKMRDVANNIWPVESIHSLFTWLPTDIQVVIQLVLIVLLALAIKRALLN